MKFPAVLSQRLSRRESEGGLRSLALRQGMDFSSNDYLGFSQDEILRRSALSALENLPLGSSGSRLLRGHLEVFERLENNLASFCGREAALFFPSGFQANLGLLSAVLTSEDLVFSDQLNHASLIDGIRLSGAQKRVFPHCNLSALRKLLEDAAPFYGLKVIVTESLFSMDGDLAPLCELVDLAEEHSALLIVDESHATGLWGDFKSNLGGGLVQSLGLQHRVFATVHTGGKALGAGGAWICGDQRLKQYLINFSRPFVFSTAPIPATAVFLNAAIEYWKQVGRDRAQVVEDASGFLLERFRLHRKERTPILPVILGENQRTLQVAERMQALGFDIRAIRPPTVPSGTSRLRVTVNFRHQKADLQRLAETLSQVLAAS